ncbi:MAG TPA: anaerobic ribonucleoside-triphosphate reductase activating protein [Erysipelotrichaceae bacterium]|nr:anaerobic ribonucleoside-triphosphate reductase activating protein [Erysipelotrichaceae bacterium]
MPIAGIDKLSLLDYEDQVSCVLFIRECNFRCPFCHNGESVLSSSNSIDFEEILEFLKTRTGLIDAVVFSGGEPTLEEDLEVKIRKVKQLGFLIKLDTNGTRPEVLEKLLKEGLIDYVAMDIKNSPSLYAETCGVKSINLGHIKRSIDLIIKQAPDYEFRTTLVKEFHEHMDIESYLSLIRGAKRLFLQKFVDSKGCIKKGLHEIDIKEADKLRSNLAKEIPEVHLRGY